MAEEKQDVQNISIPVIEDIMSAVAEAANFAAMMRDVGYGDAEGRKNGPNFATGADRAVEGILHSALSQLDPDAGFISEDDPHESTNGRYWIVDPIDGTANFAAGLDFAVSAAYAIEDGTIVAGAVYSPSAHVSYWAVIGQGAYMKEDGGKEEHLSFSEKRASNGNLLFGMPRDPKKAARVFGNVSCVSHLFDDVKRYGPTSLDICRTASGPACAYLGMEPEEWDIAAAGLVVEEAGGTLTLPEGTDVIAAGHSDYVDEMISLLGLA